MKVSLICLWVAPDGVISALQEIGPSSESIRSPTILWICLPIADLIFDWNLRGKGVPSGAIRSLVATVLALNNSSNMPERDPVVDCNCFASVIFGKRLTEDAGAVMTCFQEDSSCSAPTLRYVFMVNLRS